MKNLRTFAPWLLSAALLAGCGMPGRERELVAVSSPEIAGRYALTGWHRPNHADPLRAITEQIVTRALRVTCPAIRAEAIVGHSEIAPGRKTDPGPHFDWARLRQQLDRA